MVWCPVLAACMAPADACVHVRCVCVRAYRPAGNIPMSFSAYLSYCDSNSDEMPLYLFDKSFAERAPGLAKDYSVPQHFRCAGVRLALHAPCIACVHVRSYPDTYARMCL